jgi:UDP-N-acetylglucosamine 3-dehydrogenase
MKVNVSVIGCGIWGRNHARVFSELSGATMRSVVDIDKNSAKHVADKYHVQNCNDPDRTFNDPEIDAVTICTPTVTHADLAIRAIEAGKHVLVEKPMTNDIDEAKTLIKAAKRKGVHLAVGFVERFNPAVREAMRVVNEGSVGRVILVHTRRVSRWPVRIGDVGVIKDLAIHDIDIVNKFFGVEAGAIFCNAGNIQHAFEDYANIVMCLPGKRAAFIETNWLTPRKIRTLTVTGTEGIINVEYIGQTVSIENQKHIYQPFIETAEPLRLELESFINSIVRDTPQEVTGEDGLRALKVCEAAIESARIGRPVVNNRDTCEYVYI